MTMILPLKTPPQMLQPPSEKVIKGALLGLQKFGSTPAGLTKMADMIAAMPDEDKALTLIEELDHLIWLSSIWLHVENFMVDVEFDVSKPSEPTRWMQAPLEKLHWCLLDRYRFVGLEVEAREWIEANAVPF